MRAFSVAVTALALLALAASAQASIVTLTDTSQLDLSGTAYALNLTGPALSVGGVTFQAAAPGSAPAGVTVAAGGIFNWSANGFGTPVVSGTDAANMGEILNTFIYQQAFIDLSVTPGQAYTLQLVGGVQSIWPTHTFSVTIGEIGPDPFTEPISNAVVTDLGLSATSGSSYLYTTEFTATASTIRIKATADSAPYVVAGGMILTSVPEPATMSLLALGALGALIRRKK